MSSFVYPIIIVISQLSKLYFLATNFHIILIGEYALASVLGLFLIAALYFWMSISINDSPRSNHSNIDWRLIKVVFYVFSRFMIFVIFALFVSFFVIESWELGHWSSDNMRLILIGHIAGSPLIVLAIAIFDQFLSAKKAKVAVRLLAYSALLNFSTSALLMQWLGIGAYFFGFIVGNLYFIIASHRRAIFTFNDYIYSLTKKRVRNLFSRAWTIAIYFYCLTIITSSLIAVLLLISEPEILAIVYFANSICFTLCVLALTLCSAYIADLCRTNSMRTEIEQRVYEKIVWLLWNIGAAAMAIVAFSGPLVSYLFPSESRQLFVHLVWMLSITYWLCLFVTPGYLLVALHQWTEDLSKHLTLTIFSLLVFAIFGVVAQNIWISLLGTILALIVSAIIFSRHVHSRARGEYRSWFPEVQGEGVFPILLVVVAGNFIAPFSTDDFFVACLFASNSLIVIFFVFLHRKKQKEGGFL